VSERYIVEELRLEGPKSYAFAKRRALLRHLATSIHRSHSLEVSPIERRAALERLRLTHGLGRRAELNNWLAENDLEEFEFNRLVDAEAHLAAASQIEEPVLTRILIDELRLANKYRALRNRAERKHAACKAEANELNSETLPPSVVELRVWFFRERLGLGFPESLEGYAQQLDFRDCHEFDSAIRREWVFLRPSEKANPIAE
jgi:hypothetical protein